MEDTAVESVKDIGCAEGEWQQSEICTMEWTKPPHPGGHYKLNATASTHDGHVVCSVGAWRWPHTDLMPSLTKKIHPPLQ